ncbi:hypothetical protein [Sphingomonas quercus]|uniref:Rod shape-determining protein MreD n=1 Tax=Sphingomonas quercus TaxID=2842451 RepID=A0ABS6BE45_9SPHN|nr:hypothetical protein [Sphingomonas quercus]MBU3076429.1 hypothetical protein [Sphingomonas quercus]
MGHQIYFLALLAVCTLAALAFGGAAERVGALMLLASVAVSALVLSPAASRYTGFEGVMFAVDAAVTAAFLMLSLRTTRFWPLWMTAMLAVETASHLVGLLDIQGRAARIVYAILVQVWIYPLCLCLLLGTIRHRMRVARLGADPSWR